MQFRRVAAIDVGLRNFAWCVADTQEFRHPVHWEVLDLWRPEPNRRRHPTRDQIVRLIVEWCRANHNLLSTCDTIVLENQLREPYTSMNTVIHALYLERVVVCHPMRVGAFWKLPKTRDLKKAAGIATVLANGVLLPPAPKLDDLADAWLMATYQLVMEGGLSELVFSK